MAETAAGRPVLGETPNLFEFIEQDNQKFVRFRPDSTFAVMDREYRNDVHTTRWGTRTTGTDAVGPEAVVFTGDSFTFGLGVDDLETFTSLVCRSRHRGCLNAGIPGTALPAQLDVVQANIEAWQHPKRIVFVFFAGNDLPEMIREREQTLASPAPAVKSSPAPNALAVINRVVNASPILSRSYLLRLMKTTARTWAMPGSMDLMFSTASGAPGELGRRARTTLAMALDRLERLSADLDFSPSFVMIPDRYQVYHSLMVNKARYYGLDPGALDMTFPQRLLASELDRRHIPYLDVSSCLDRQDKTLYYQHDNHLTRAGHEAVAACITRSQAVVP